MIWTAFRAVAAIVIVFAVATTAGRSPRVGAIILGLPLISIAAMIVVWAEHQNLSTVSRLSRDMLIVVPLGLPFFIPLAFADRFGIGFWTAMSLGAALASVPIGLWTWLSH